MYLPLVVWGFSCDRGILDTTVRFGNLCKFGGSLMKKNDSISCCFFVINSLPFSLITFDLTLISADLVWCPVPSSELMWFVYIVESKWAWQDSHLDIPGLVCVCIYIAVFTEDRGHEIVSIGMASYEVKGFETSQLGLESVLLWASMKGLENKYEPEMTVSRNKLMIIWIRKWEKNDRKMDKFILEESVMTRGERVNVLQWDVFIFHFKYKPFWFHHRKVNWGKNKSPT